MAPKPSRDTLIHCDACGEDYSSTYRRCPFCGARNDPRRASREDTNDTAYNTAPASVPSSAPKSGGEELEDNYVFDGQDVFEEDREDEEAYGLQPKGGKRLAPRQGGGGFDLPPINWPRLITFLCSLVIIVAALIIVFTVIYPQLRGNNDPKPDASAEVSTAPTPGTEAPPTPGMVPSVDPVGEPSQPLPESLPPAQPEVTGITLKSNGWSLSANDITLYLGESAQLEAVITPSGWSGPITWTSSNPEWITVSDTGLVTNVNNTGSFHNAYLTITAGGLSVQCVVRVRAIRSDTTTPVIPDPQPGASAPPASQPPASQAPASGGTVAVGRTGTIVGADSGLRVRSGPGTTYEILASLNNGNTVNVLADAGGGWYQISFAGSSGTITGYIMGEYISSN